MSFPTRQPVARCGTPSGWSRHKNDGERPCNACFKAKAEYDARRRNASSEAVVVSRARAAAQARANTALRRRYPEEYRALYVAALQDVGQERGLDL